MSWTTKTLGELCIIKKGNIGINNAVPGEYPLVVTGEERKSHYEYQFDDEAVIIPLVSSTGHGHKSLKRIHYQTGKFAVGSILCAVIPKNKSILKAEYLYRYLYLNKERELVGRMKGMANVSLPLKEIAKIEIPLPPLDEQEDFVESYLRLEGTKNELSDELSHQLYIVKQLRQTFLREAIQGKLTVHWRNENPDVEPASELLKKIKAEKEKLIREGKLKNEKPMPPIKKDEIPFQIPESWEWCRLGEFIYDTEGGKSPNCLNESVVDNDWGVIKTTAIQEMIFLENENKILPKDFIVNEQHKVYENDLLITRAGPKNRVGIVCCVENLKKNLILSDKTIRIKHSKQLLNSKYIAYSLNSPLIKPIVESKMTGMADSQVNISQNNMKKFPIPFPPLSEQQQIVTKLDELMQYRDQLEVCIKTSQQQNEMLLQQELQDFFKDK